MAGLLAGAAPAGAAEVPSPKRGVAAARFLSVRPSALARLNAAWSYDWSAKRPRGRAAAGWVPMLWGADSVRPNVIDRLAAAKQEGRAQELLGFNEPDMSSQSNMTPEQAADLWPQLERTGLRLGSPAPASPGRWFGRFMSLAQARHLRVDFLALHFYQDFTAAHPVRDLRRQLARIHARYGRPLWITEIGAMDIRRWHEPMRRRPTSARATTYMRRLFKMLDSLPYVERYAWFTDECSSDAGCRYSALFTHAGRLTATGRAFRR